MCEIQFIKRLDGKNLDSKDIDVFDSLMNMGSWCNPDAWGIFTDSFRYKETGNYKTKDSVINSLKDTDWVVGHNRYATTGDKEKLKNNHPFESRNFRLVHNGVIHNHKELITEHKLSYKGDTDSLVILYLIEKFYDKNKRNIVQAIQKTTKLLDGYYSVFLYDKRNKVMYYFKSEKAQFTFVLYKFGTKSVLLGSTKKDNFKEVYCKRDMIFNVPTYKRRVYETAESGIIYRIEDTIEEINTFEESKVVNYYNWGYSEENRIKEDEEVVNDFFTNLYEYVPEYNIDGDRVYIGDATSVDYMDYYVPIYYMAGQAYMKVQDICQFMGEEK